jgi:Leucine-rich repeat (LRR) protein/HPt (histidine-containing phosphotransfer) domain-containing protein
MPISIAHLPEETLLEIFVHVDIVRAIRTVSRVCKAWRQLSQDPHLYTELNFTTGELGHHLSDILFKKAIAMCPKVQVINMSKTHITSAGLDIIVRSCKELRSIDLSFCVRLKNAKYDSLLTLPHFHTLNLIGTWKLSDTSLTGLAPFFTHNIKLSMTIELLGGNLSPHEEENLFHQLLKLDTIDLHLSHELAKSFLDSPRLHLFAPSIVYLEIGSRFTTSTIAHVPPQIGCLSSLTSLNIISHTLQELPNEISNLTNLRSLLISNSRGHSTFTSLPPQITQLCNLESLNLCWNRITDIPASIVNMTSLRRLNISNNSLEIIPPELGQMTRLKRLNLSENKLRNIPDSIGELACLDRLILSRNNLTHISDKVFENLNNLQIVDLQHNKLTELPTTIARNNIRELIANNNFLEKIPSNVGTGLPRLKKLILHENRLSSLPTKLDGLSSLKHLSLSGNHLEQIPSAIGTMSNLRVLQLSHNKLQELPGSVMFMRKLRKVELQSNQFTSLISLKGIQGVDSLKSVHFDEYLQEDHSELCMCKFCIFARFDEAHFEEIVEGDAEFEEELINLFFNCTETDFTYMTKAIADNAFDDIFFISHKIKGALSNMGAVKLSQVCSLLEGQARDHNLTSCIQLFGKLKLEYKHIKHVLVRRLQRCGKPYPPFSFSYAQAV